MNTVPKIKSAAVLENERKMVDKELRKAMDGYRMGSDVRAKGVENWSAGEARDQALGDVVVYQWRDTKPELSFVFPNMVAGVAHPDYKSALTEFAPQLMGAVGLELAGIEGVLMDTLPGKKMVFNNAPGQAGAEVVDLKNGSRICLGNKESVESFAQENKLSLQELGTLVAMDSLADKYRSPGPDKVHGLGKFFEPGPGEVFAPGEGEFARMTAVAQEKVEGATLSFPLTDDGQVHVGPVLAVGEFYALQKTGREVFSLHHLVALDQKPIEKQNLSIKYGNQVGAVVDLDLKRSQDVALGVGR